MTMTMNRLATRAARWAVPLLLASALGAQQGSGVGKGTGQGAGQQKPKPGVTVQGLKGTTTIEAIKGLTDEMVLKSTDFNSSGFGLQLDALDKLSGQTALLAQDFSGFG